MAELMRQCRCIYASIYCCVHVWNVVLRHVTKIGKPPHSPTAIEIARVRKRKVNIVRAVHPLFCQRDGTSLEKKWRRKKKVWIEYGAAAARISTCWGFARIQIRKYFRRIRRTHTHSQIYFRQCWVRRADAALSSMPRLDAHFTWHATCDSGSNFRLAHRRRRRHRHWGNGNGAAADGAWWRRWIQFATRWNVETAQINQSFFACASLALLWK